MCDDQNFPHSMPHGNTRASFSALEQQLLATTFTCLESFTISTQECMCDDQNFPHSMATCALPSVRASNTCLHCRDFHMSWKFHEKYTGAVYTRYTRCWSEVLIQNLYIPCYRNTHAYLGACEQPLKCAAMSWKFHNKYRNHRAISTGASCG